MARIGDRYGLGDCMFFKAKICKNCCAYFELALSFQPPAKPAPPELTKLFESGASSVNRGAGSAG
jgi:hypothetical protein